MAEDPVAPLVADFARYRADDDFALADFDTADTDDMDREQARRELASLNERIAELQARLYAEESRGVLVVLQGIDAAGKDSTVKHVFRGSNPQGVRVYTFKEPSDEEAAHDFLWRYHADAPSRGMIHVFNRSHYEDGSSTASASAWSVRTSTTSSRPTTCASGATGTPTRRRTRTP
jgi:polyphosphate kinase 2 (PPK2 family)